jgi:prevent-host-death family protein
MFRGRAAAADRARTCYIGLRLGEKAMKHVNLSEARANLAELLDEVERGETLVISRDGEAATATPSELEQELRDRRRRAVDNIMELRKHNKPVSVDEIIAWKNEGRR